MIKKITLLLIASVLFFRGYADNFDASFEIAPHKLDITDFLEVKLTISHPTSYNINIEKLRTNLCGKIAIFNIISEKAETYLKDKQINTTITYILEPLKPGVLPISFYDIELSSSTNHKTIYTNVTNISIMPPNKTYEEIFNNTWKQYLSNQEIPLPLYSDNKDKIFHQYETQRKIILIVAVATTIFSLLILNRKKISRIVKKTTPIKQAYKEFKRLNNKKLIEKKLMSEYYIELGNILCKYLFSLNLLPIEEKTTNNLIELIYSLEIDSKLKQSLQIMLQKYDLIKFAGKKSNTLECLHAKKTFQEFIHLQKGL